MKKGQKKKQERALKKRSQRRQKLAHRRVQTAISENPTRIIRQARKYPIEVSWVQRGWQESGLAAILVARRQPDAVLLYGNYLVDYYCLGVKDTFCNANVPSGRFHNELVPRVFMGESPLEISPALAHEIIYGAIEYAAQFEFRPHRDFMRSQYVLDPPDAHPRTGTVEFGKDGKPFYVAGPRDNATAIVNQLDRTAGEGNFDYVAFADLSEDSHTPEDEDEDEDDSLLWVPSSVDDDDDRPRSPLWTPGR